MRFSAGSGCICSRNSALCKPEGRFLFWESYWIERLRKEAAWLDLTLFLSPSRTIPYPRETLAPAAELIVEPLRAPKKKKKKEEEECSKLSRYKP
ncbi:hypothetical protein QQF64_024580 [Cirrhinus molitorella]|uniref:Uncharacterized protein n=1 Tax=Cirrhinus molitorella TaxID=172907 RepID=A0ABR3NLM1_9TELE